MFTIPERPSATMVCPDSTAVGGSDTPAVVVRNLVKSYGGRRVVDDLSFAVRRGEVFGMLGPNGAGKTTTIEILEGLRSPDSGTVEVLGMDVRRHQERIKLRIGIAAQVTSLLPNLTCHELLSLWATFYPRPLAAETLLSRLSLTEKRNTLVQSLSGGQQQRLSLALALIGDPELLFLDEPTTGLDPHARRELWGIIQSLRQDGKTLLLTTHYMDEAEQLCDRIAIIDRGKLLTLDTPARLIAQHFPGRPAPVPGPNLEEVFLHLTGRPLWEGNT